MAWTVVNPTFWTKFDNGTFEGSDIGDVSAGVVDGHAQYGFSTAQKKDGTKSFLANLLDSPSYSFSGNYAHRNLVRFRPGGSFVAGRRYTFNGFVYFGNRGHAVVDKNVYLKVKYATTAFPDMSTIANINCIVDSDILGFWIPFSYQFIAPSTTTASNSWLAFALNWDKDDYTSSPVEDMQIFFDGFTAKEESNEPPPPINITGIVTNVSSHGANNGSIDASVTGGIGPFTYSWNNGATTQDIFALVPGTYTVIVTDTVGGAVKSQSFNVTEPSVMVASYTKTDATADGESDGSITLAVSGGSGNRTFLWNDGPTSQNRVGLIAGIYTVLIHDVSTSEEIFLTIEITEPAPTVVNGTFLTVPTMNSIHFVVREVVSQCDNPQGLDNVLLCEQEHEGFDQVNYFQPFNICDVVSTQFNSDFLNFAIELRKYSTSEVVKTFSYELKEQNIGVTEDFGIAIRAHTTTGQSRVYFNSGPLPIPLSVGDVFQIINNVNGYNGNYGIVDIINDPTLGYQYLVITKNYTGPGTSQSGTGRFDVSNTNFNVFESVHNFSDVPEGQYYIRILAFDTIEGFNFKEARSEPLDIRNTHPGTNQIKYKNIDNAFDITWTTGYQGMIRVPSHFGHRRSPGGERSTNRNSDYSIVKVSAKKTRVILFQVWSLPPYMHEKLGTLLDCDNYTINNIECQTTEGYAEPEYKDRSLLANSSVKLEAKWYDRYNSDDLGSVAEGGFIMTETGFLKR